MCPPDPTCPPIPHGSQLWFTSAPHGRGCFGQGGLGAPGSQCTGRAQWGTAQGTPPPASQGTHSLPSPPSPLLLRAPRRPVGQRGAVRAHRAGHQRAGRERGGDRTYGSSWGSGRPLKERRGNWVKGSWRSPGDQGWLQGRGQARGPTSLTGSPRSPLLPGAPGLPCRKEGRGEGRRGQGTHGAVGPVG